MAPGKSIKSWLAQRRRDALPAIAAGPVKPIPAVSATVVPAEPSPGGPVSPPSPPEAKTSQTVPDPVLEVATSHTPEFDQVVPRGLQIAASWSWRVILIVAVLYGVVWLLRYASEVVIPVAVAILLTAMISPVTNRLNRWGIPRAAAAIISVLGGILLIAGALTLIGTQIANQAASLGTSVVAGFNQVVDWLKNGPLHINQTWFDVDQWYQRIQNFLIDSQSAIATYASEIGTQVGHFIAGVAILLFSLFYFLYEGRKIFAFLLKFVPKAARNRVDAAAHVGWSSLSQYVRAVILVALVDAIGVLVGALILGVPLAPALAALVFIGAFIPIVGAFVSGFVAVLVALVSLGWLKALIMLAIIVAVMQIEGHVLQPFLLGRAVKLHPLAVILTIAVGVIVAGIVGALMAVPVLAFTKTFVQDLNDSAQGLSPAGQTFT